MKGFNTFYAKSGWYKMFTTEDRVQEKVTRPGKLCLKYKLLIF